MKRCRAAFLASAFASLTLLFTMVGCGDGVAPERVDGGGIGVGQCTPLVCPPEAAWDPVSCACQPIASATSPGCSARCPSGTVLAIANGVCGCVAFPEGGVEPLDATLDAPVVTYYDASSDSDADPGLIPCQLSPGFGCESNPPGCTCVQDCHNSCPSGQTFGAHCNGCYACTSKCPQGFVFGAGCSCVPDGTMPSDPDPGGPYCVFMGSFRCEAGLWCPMGTCPDGQTTYGCYCDLQGHLTCQMECPSPPTDGGVTCLIEGYDYGPNAPGAVTCNAGSFCAIGTCPNSTTPFGCVCNADGTATCNLDCGPEPCAIYNEGTCPSGSQCQFGSCDGSSSEIVSCSCDHGNALCSTSLCPDGDSGSDGG